MMNETSKSINSAQSALGGRSRTGAHRKAIKNVKWKYKESICDKKTSKIFSRFGKRASRLKGGFFPADVQEKITLSLMDLGYTKQKADRIAFHMVDWNLDAAFITALILYPEKFTLDDISDGVIGFLIHAPDHLAAAAKLIGDPVTDVFEVGVSVKSKKPKKKSRAHR
jgi:hypothetical protein